MTDEMIEELRLSAVMIRTWAPETFPANESGQVHFARAIMESVAETIEKALAAATASAAETDNWRDDPSRDERWNAGVDFVMTRLCDFLSVDPQTVNWDAATETLDGDVQSVLGNILRRHFGEYWGPGVNPPLTAAPASAAEPAAWITADAIENLQAEGMCALAAGRKQSVVYSLPIYTHPPVAIDT